jgi:hypothetical protein
MRSPDLLVVADEAEAPEIVCAFGSAEGPQERWPAIVLGRIGEEELTYLGIALGVCDGDERDAVADELLSGEPPGPYVCRVVPELIEALIRLHPADVRRVGKHWRDADFRPCGGSGRVAILARMAELARQAKAAGKTVVRACPGYEHQGRASGCP